MNRQSELQGYILGVRGRLRQGASARGAAIVAASALVATLVLVWILNAYAFPDVGVGRARLVLVGVLALAAWLGLAWPLLRLGERRSILRAEEVSPEFEQRLLTFHERQRVGGDPFLELLAADTLTVARAAPASRLVSARVLLAFFGVALVSVAGLVWMVTAAPGYMGYGASLLWTGPKPNVAALYSIHVSPGDVAVRRHSDQAVTAEVVGLPGEVVRLYARFGGAGSRGWEPVAMKPLPVGGFHYLFTGLPEDVEYYVQAGRVSSPHYKVRVVDLPSVKLMQVTYHYPRWTGMRAVSEEHAGDLRAIEGTEAELHITTDRPLKDGMLVLDGGKVVRLSGGESNVYRGSVAMVKDGAYHLAAADGGQQVRLSEDFFIATDKASPPEIAIVRPGADYRASPIEEVTIGVKATGEFGLSGVNLHYTVNGGPDRSVNLLKQAGAKSVNGTTTLNLEEFKLVPGDVVSLYATAKDGHAEARTEISFLQADPFEREFSQSQQGGGGGGGGGGQQSNQTDISKRQKELIAATWKQQNEKGVTAKANADAGKFLSDVQTKLRDQVLALAGRMESRDLASANEEFTSFGKDMQAAAAAMAPSAEKLKGSAWPEALPAEQKALQALLRAEATFRKIEVAFGQQRGGGGGGGGGSAGRDLASLFDLELDTQKNQYESAQRGSGASPGEAEAKAVDDALAKLDALARRQEELAQKEQHAPPGFEERWQQEMLRREAEQLQKQMEQMAQQSQSGGQQSSQQASASSGQAGQSGKPGQAGKSGQSQASGGQPGSAGGASGSQGGEGSQGPSAASDAKQSGARQAGAKQAGAKQTGGDPRVEEALNRLRQANEAMKRGAGQAQGAEASQQAAEELRQATSLLSGTQRQQASGRLDGLSREAQRLSREQRAQAERMGSPGGGQGQTGGQMAAAERGRLAEDRQRLSDDLSRLERGLRDTARQLAPTQPGASTKLREALGQMDQAELSNRVQRTADWLRRGINPNTGGTEGEIGKGLESLSAQVGEAQRGMGSEMPGSNGRGGGRDPGRQTAALDHVERLRGEVESLARGGQPGPGRQQAQGDRQPGGRQAGQPGQQAGQGGQQPGGAGQGGSGRQPGSPGQAQAQGAQPGAGPGQGVQPGGRQPGAMQGGGQQGGSAPGLRSGDVGNRASGGGAQGPAWDNVNTGNNRFNYTGPRVVTPGSVAPPPSDRVYQESLAELNQLRQLAGNDPAAAKQVQDLIREMQRLDPSRFPGNPALVEQLHAQVLSGIDKLELQLRRDRDDSAQVRTAKTATVAPQYQEAVADYFRRLSKAP